MFQYSIVFRPLFWMTMGLTYAVIIAGANIWARDLGLEMNWWKWLMAAVWYGILSLITAAGFTLIGEKEPKAGPRFLAFGVTLCVVSGIGLAFLVCYL